MLTPRHAIHFDIAHMNLQLDNLGIIVQNAIAPALVIAAVAMHLRLLNNRLSRIVDRQRKLQHLPVADRPHAIARRHEMIVLRRRQRRIHRSIFLAAGCALLVCFVIVALFVDDVFRAQIDAISAVLFVTAMVCLVLSYLYFLGEVLLSIRKLKLTIRGSRRLRPE